jgi:hypothetical protein
VLFRSWAAQTEGPYQVSVPVQGQGTEERDKALETALEQVLLKVTGQSKLAKGKLKGQAARLTRQYRYETLPAQGDQPEQQRLVVEFDPQALEKGLRDSGAPLLGSKRPSLLVWLGLEEDGQRRFWVATADQPLAETLNGVAKQRDWPLIYPLVDAEDQAKVEAADLWGGGEAKLREASRRYGAELLLIGRPQLQEGEAWRVDWQLLQGGRSTTWQTRGNGRAATLAAGLNEALDRVAARVSAATGEQPAAAGLLVAIDGVDSLAGFARAEQALAGAEGVERRDLVLMEPQRVWFRVHGGGGAETLARSLGAGGRLEAQSAVPADGNDAGPVPDLLLRLLP